MRSLSWSSPAVLLILSAFAHGCATDSRPEQAEPPAIATAAIAVNAANAADPAPEPPQLDTAAEANPPVSDALVPIERAKLLAGDRAGGDQAGYSVALSGDTALLGAPFDNHGGGTDAGSAYVFVRSGDSWTEQARLHAGADAAAGDRFGSSVALSGDTAIVGAWYEDNAAGPDAGCAYVYVRNGTTWTQQAKLTASDGAAQRYFGVSSALEGDTVIIGAYGSGGGAYVFVRNGITWTQQAKLVPDDGTFGYFGGSVALSGETALVGDDFNGVDGAAFVFTRSGTTWAQQAKLTSSDIDANDAFGSSVALDGDTALVGAEFESNAAGAGAGSAYVFTRSGATWTQQVKLLPSDGEADTNFGNAVALAGDLALIGSFWDNTPAGSRTGSAYAFTRSGNAWTERTKFVPSDAGGFDHLGRSMALSGALGLVGAPDDDVDGLANAGSAYAVELVDQRANGAACSGALECLSGSCVDGVCCDTACGGGAATDCQACSVAEGALADGVCGPRSANAICRNNAGDCDVAEVCDGTATACPPDVLVPDGTVCTDGACMAGTCVPASGAGGSGGASSSATATGAGTGGSGEPTDEGGCGCRLVGSACSGAANDGARPSWWLALGLLVAARRRAKVPEKRGGRG